MIKTFDEFVCDMKSEINDYIIEMSGFSEKSNIQLNTLIDHIKKCVKEKHISPITKPNELKSVDCQCFNIERDCSKVVIDNSIIHLNITIVNTQNDINSFWVNLVSNAEIIPMVGKESKSMEFVLNGYVLFQNWRFMKCNHKVLSHEMMHSYNYQKEYFGKYGQDIFDKWDETQDWKNFYMLAHNYMKNHNEDDYVVKLCKGIYAMDTREMNAFSQELNIELEDAENKQKIDQICKQSGIYRCVKDLKILFKLLNTKSFDYEYIVSQLIKTSDDPDSIVCPSKKWLVKTIDKRLDKYYKNIGDACIKAKNKIVKNGETINETVLMRLSKPDINFYKII